MVQNYSLESAGPTMTANGLSYFSGTRRRTKMHRKQVAGYGREIEHHINADGEAKVRDGKLLNSISAGLQSLAGVTSVISNQIRNNSLRKQGVNSAEAEAQQILAAQLAAQEVNEARQKKNFQTVAIVGLAGLIICAIVLVTRKNK
jgi:hypothetical protein